MANDSITVIYTVPDIDNASICPIPARNCIEILYSPDNYLVSAPTKFGTNISPDPLYGNFSVGDRVAISIANGEQFQFNMVAAGTSTSIYDIEIGGTALLSCQSIGLALQQIAYININYYINITAGGFSIVAKTAGSQWSVSVSTDSDTFYFLNNIVAAGDLKVLKNYRICTELIELLDECLDIYGNPLEKSIGKICKWAEPVIAECPPTNTIEYQWQVRTNIQAIALQLFDYQVPADCENQNLTLVYMPDMKKHVKYRYYSDRVDSSGFSQPQNYTDSNPFFVADIGNTEDVLLTQWLDNICSRRQPISVQQQLLDYMTCLSTCHILLFYAQVASPTTISISVRWFVANVFFGTYNLILNGTADTTGFYQVPITMQELYNQSYILSGGTLPATEYISTFDVQILGGAGLSLQRLRWGYDHQMCCRLQCTNYIIFRNEYGGFDTMCIQCHIAEFDHIGEEFCRLDACNESGEDASGGKWATDGIKYSLSVWTMPAIVRDVTGVLNYQDQGVEKLIRSIVRAGMGWMPVNGLLRKVIIQDNSYDRLKNCHKFKFLVSY